MNKQRSNSADVIQLIKDTTKVYKLNYKTNLTMTNKEKALRIVAEHWRFLYFRKEVLSELPIGYCNEQFYRQIENIGFVEIRMQDAIQHAKLTATKISEHNPEEGRELLEELEKL